MKKKTGAEARFPPKFYLKPSSQWRNGEPEIVNPSEKFRVSASPVFNIINRNPTVPVKSKDKERIQQKKKKIDPNGIYPDWWFDNLDISKESDSCEVKKEKTGNKIVKPL